MKSFLISLILIALMIGGVSANCIYINKVGIRIRESAEQLPDPTDPSCLRMASELEAQWKKDARWIHISVNHTIVDRIGEQASTLVACAQSGDLYGFFTARALLLDAVEDMQRLEHVEAIL
jgi:hypothetical protein